MDIPDIVETRRITLKDNQILEVQMSQPFIDKLRQHFGLFGEQQLEDEHVKMYVWGAVSTAVEKAEEDVKDAVKPKAAKRVRKPRRRKKDA